MDVVGHGVAPAPPLEPPVAHSGSALAGPTGVQRQDSPALAVGRLLWSKRRAIGRAILAGLILGAIVSLLIPTQYQATVRLMPPDSQGSSGMAMLAALSGKAGIPIAATAGDLLGIKTTGALFVGVLQSRTVQDRLIDRFDLRREYWRKTYEATRKKLASRTDVMEDRKTGIITLSTTDHSPVRAAQLAQAYVDELDRLMAELTTSSAHRERVFLEQRLAVVKQELDDASREFSQFASQNAAIDIKEQGRAMVEAAATLQGQLIAAKSELNGLRQIYTEDNVRVRSVNARVAELQRQLEKLGGKSGQGGDTDQLYPSIRRLPLLGVRYSDLYRRTKISETVFETLTQQYELAKVQEVKEIPTVRVLDRPVPPEKKTFPPRTLFTLAGGFLGLFAAIGFVIVAELWREIDDKEPHKEFLGQVAAETIAALKNRFRTFRRRPATSMGETAAREQ